MTTEVQLVLDIFLLIQYLICCIIYFFSIPYVHLNVTFKTRIIGKFHLCWLTALYIAETELKVKKIIFLFFSTSLHKIIRSKCCSMLTVVLVMCEAKPNSVFSFSDVESKEGLTQGWKKKVDTFFGEWDPYYFRKQNGFLWQNQSSLPTITTTTTYIQKIITLLKVLKPTNEKEMSSRTAYVSKILKYKGSGQGLSNTGIWSYLIKGVGL